MTPGETTRRELVVLEGYVMCEERWGASPRLPHHEVSTHARVRSIGHMSYTKDGKPHGARPGRLIKLRRSRDGHLIFGTYVEGVRSTVHVHAMMLEAFVGPRPPGMVGRHFNDVPDDNRLSNLAWGTLEDNAQDSVRNGGHRNTAKKACPRDHAYVQVNLYGNQAGRRCRACNRTRVHFHGRDVSEAEFRAYADLAYAKITGAVT